MFLCGQGASKTRNLIANTPLMYRQTLAMAVHRHNPDFEVMIANPTSMDGEAERFAPHVLVRDDDGIEVGSPEGVVCWVGVNIDDHLKVRISVEGKVSEVHEAAWTRYSQPSTRSRNSSPRTTPAKGGRGTRLPRGCAGMPRTCRLLMFCGTSKRPRP